MPRDSLQYRQKRSGRNQSNMKKPYPTTGVCYDADCPTGLSIPHYNDDHDTDRYCQAQVAEQLCGNKADKTNYCRNHRKMFL